MPSGNALIWLGLALLAADLALNYAPGGFGWFGKLPGDIRVQDGIRYIFIPHQHDRSQPLAGAVGQPVLPTLRAPAPVTRH